MNLIIRPQGQEEFSVTLEDGKTLGDLMEEISQHLSRDVDSFRLVHRGRVLLSENAQNSLSELNIHDNDAIEVLINIRPSRPVSESASSRPSSAFEVAGPGLAEAFGSQVIDMAIHEGSEGHTVHGRINGQEADSVALTEMMEHLPHGLGQFLGGIMSQITREPEGENTPQPQSPEPQSRAPVAPAQPRLAEQPAAEPRPTTRRENRRVVSERVVQRMEASEAENSSLAVSEIEDIYGQMLRERQQGREIVNECIEKTAVAIKDEAQKLDECTSHQEYRACYHSIARMQVQLKRMLCNGNTHLAELLDCLESDGLNTESERSVLQRVLEYLE